MNGDLDDYVDEGSGDRYERVLYERDEPERFDPPLASIPPSISPAARRRRQVLLILLGAVVVTGIGGFIASMLWALTVIALLALVAYVGLMAWMATHQPAGRRGADRLVAHGVADPVYDDSYREPAGGYDDAEDDGWWEEPRRASAR